MFDKVVQLRPRDFDLWIGLARYHHLHNRWEEAAAAYARVDQSHPTDGEWGEYAALLLLAADHEGHHKLCLRVFQNGRSPAYLARMAALSPNPPLDPALIVSLAQRGKNPNFAWTRHTLSLAHYRAGAWEAAMRLLQEPNQPRWGHPHASGKLLQAQLNELLLAMCQFRMGQVEEAQKRLTNACKIIDHATCYTVDDPFVASPFDWPPLILLRREAESLILKQTAPGSPAEKTNPKR
jgi:tetratricopeptide (TPR) repeat protein